jgi:hypothetical protein
LTEVQSFFRCAKQRAPLNIVDEEMAMTASSSTIVKLVCAAVAVAVAAFAAVGCKKDEKEADETRAKDEPAQTRGRPAAGGEKERPGAASVTDEVAKKWAEQGLDGVYTLVAGPKVYLPKNLYKLLNGGADIYIEAGLVSLAHMRFEAKSKEEMAQCRVSMFFMKDEKSARKLLEKEKDDPFEKVQVGDEGWADKEGLLFKKGRAYVRVDSAASRRDQKPCPFLKLGKAMAATEAVAW